MDSSGGADCLGAFSVEGAPAVLSSRFRFVGQRELARGQALFSMSARAVDKAESSKVKAEFKKELSTLKLFDELLILKLNVPLLEKETLAIIPLSQV